MEIGEQGIAVLYKLGVTEAFVPVLRLRSFVAGNAPHDDRRFGIWNVLEEE